MVKSVVFILILHKLKFDFTRIAQLKICQILDHKTVKNNMKS